MRLRVAICMLALVVACGDGPTAAGHPVVGTWVTPTSVRLIDNFCPDYDPTSLEMLPQLDSVVLRSDGSGERIDHVARSNLCGPPLALLRVAVSGRWEVGEASPAGVGRVVIVYDVVPPAGNTLYFPDDDIMCIPFDVINERCYDDLVYRRVE